LQNTAVFRLGLQR